MQSQSCHRGQYRLTKADAQASIELHPSQKLDDVEEDAHFAVDPRQVDEELAQIHNVSAVHPAPLLHQPSPKPIGHNCDCNTRSTCEHLPSQLSGQQIAINFH